MGDACYICKKNFKWMEEKITFAEIMSKNTAGSYREIPQGFAFGDNKLCISCVNALPTKDHKKNHDAHKDEQKAADECYWCKEQGRHKQFCSNSSWVLEDHVPCTDCNERLLGLTSIKLRELISLERNNSAKIKKMNELHSEASWASTQAGLKKYSDVFSGVANTGSLGGFIPNSDTQYLENSANQGKGSLELNLMDAKQESIRISNLIKNEKMRLAKKHFFNLDSNESETKVHSTNTTNTNESSDPVIILKMRLAKGEITLEEYKKIKENLV
jgi:hypothetical protein